MSKKSIKPRKQAQAPKVSKKVKVQLGTTNPFSDYSPTFVDMPPVVMQDIMRSPSKEVAKIKVRVSDTCEDLTGTNNIRFVPNKEKHPKEYQEYIDSIQFFTDDLPSIYELVGPKPHSTADDKLVAKVQSTLDNLAPSEEKEPVKTYVDISKSAKDSKFLASTYGMTEEEQEALKATTDKVVSEYNNPKEYPMIYTGKTKSQWEKFRAMVNRRKPIQAVINWFKNLFK